MPHMFYLDLSVTISNTLALVVKHIYLTYKYCRRIIIHEQFDAIPLLQDAPQNVHFLICTLEGVMKDQHKQIESSTNMMFTPFGLINFAIGFPLLTTVHIDK
ncbi:hypothetical protein HanRHA438_Chr16g0751661 [Helianthus annuus]|nr:hypothetical protein HanRHA438_Chr16g0751661 [Helianthus annuus]